MAALIDAFEDYVVLEDDSAKGLRGQVIARMTEGYLPLGGVSVALSESDTYRYTIFCQAMLKPTIQLQNAVAQEEEEQLTT